MGLSNGPHITISEDKSDNSKECIVHDYWYFNYGSKFQKSVCNGCHDLLMLSLNISNVTSLTVKGIDHCCIQKSVCNSCHDLLMVSLNTNNITNITVKDIDYRCIISAISNFNGIHPFARKLCAG